MFGEPALAEHLRVAGAGLNDHNVTIVQPTIADLLLRGVEPMGDLAELAIDDLTPEEKVADQLAKLPDGWHCLHSVPGAVSRNGGPDIDLRSRSCHHM